MVMVVESPRSGTRDPEGITRGYARATCASCTDVTEAVDNGLEIVRSPTVAKHDGDRHRAGVVARWDGFRIANDLREQVVDVQLIEQQRKERWGPRQLLRPPGDQAERLQARVVL